jgi:hypothetical protein
MGIDLYQVGEVSAKIHSKLAKLFEVSEDDLVMSSFDSFVYYKGHEQTSINLYIRIDLEEKYRPLQNKVAEFLLEASKEFSVHCTLYFNYIKESDIYQRVDNKYPRYLTFENAKPAPEEEYDENKEYSDEEVYTENIFAKLDDEGKDGPLSFDELRKKQ